ncbi:MAG: AAA family ATPase [Algoriphagus sp.]|uniref:AAA family ATPase n=1 Tax=Algoriphagus sp. TaxID=1872435 RepID=UPI002614FD69|nr:AAA family ATPase [Algoriphagus sp.]MDG1277115.1 AAA family ATPase [Algoriphagus sp.]
MISLFRGGGNVFDYPQSLDCVIMKKHSKVNSVLVMVMGLPGSGKSYFAKGLAKEIGAEYLGSDEIRKEIGLMGSYQMDNKLSVYEEMLSRAKEIHKSGRSLVLDGTFYLQKIRDPFISFAKSLSWKLLIIHIKADEELISKRLSKPREDSEADMEVYQKIKSEFEPIREAHLLIQSTDSALQESVEKAVKYIHSDHE